MEDNNLADIDKQTIFIKYHYAKNYPDVLEAFMED